jgi:hypothetical protein
MRREGAPELGSLDYWREVVRAWAEIHRSARPNARQVREPETAAKVLHMLSQGGTSQRAMSRAVGVSRREMSRIGWHHRDAMELCRVAAATERRSLAPCDAAGG